MREETIYIADDGTEFWDEDECQEYEEKQMYEMVCDTLKFYDISQKLITDASLSEALRNSYYIKVLDENAWETLERITCNTGYSSPIHNEIREMGTWYYDENYKTYGKWFHLETEIKKLNKMVEGFED